MIDSDDPACMCGEPGPDERTSFAIIDAGYDEYANSCRDCRPRVVNSMLRDLARDGGGLP